MPIKKQAKRQVKAKKQTKAKPEKQVKVKVKKQVREKPKVKSRSKPKSVSKPQPVCSVASAKMDGSRLRVIPPEMVPEVGSEVLQVDGKHFIQSNEAMFTFYQRTKGELSPYFLALKEKKQILGAKCPQCQLVRVPLFELYCPECDFRELELIEVSDTGVMNSTPPITYFAHSLFAHQVPFGRGRVLLKGADTALPIHVYTTRGVLTPRVFKKGTPVKVVFRQERLGKPTDIFAVPLDEVPVSLREKKGLEENELDYPGIPL